MLSNFTNQALAAKVRARFAHCLSEAEYQELLQKHSGSELTAWLKNQPGYSQLLRDVQESSIHRGQLEQILRRNVFLQYLELLHFDFSGQESYYAHSIRKIEIEQILQMIQALNSGDVQGYVSQVPSFASPHLSFELMSLSRASDFDSLLRLLPHKPYEEILLPLRPISGERINYNACEKALYTNYYKELYRILNCSFRGKAREELTKVISTGAQLMNLESTYRLKKFYHMSPEELKKYLLPVEAVNPSGDARQAKLFERMLQAATPEDLLREFAASPYGKYTGNMEKKEQETTEPEGGMIEYAGECIRYRFSIEKLYFSTNAAVIFTAYLTLLEVETQNLITVIEGVHYGLTADEIHKMLVLPSKLTQDLSEKSAGKIGK